MIAFEKYLIRNVRYLIRNTFDSFLQNLEKIYPALSYYSITVYFMYVNKTQVKGYIYDWLYVYLYIYLFKNINRKYFIIHYKVLYIILYYIHYIIYIVLYIIIHYKTVLNSP